MDINEFTMSGNIPSLTELIDKDVLFNVLKIMQGNEGLDYKIILEIDDIYQMKSNEKKTAALSEWINKINELSINKKVIEKNNNLSI
ncbi:hypothetical protein D3C87_351500 [compost metagenome]